MKKDNKQSFPIYLDSVDYVSEIGLNNFLVPDRIGFTSLKQVVNYAKEIVPKRALEAYAHIHTDKHEADMLIMRKLVDGSIETFKFW